MFVPESSWVAPTELPDLRARGRAALIGLDTETKDKGLADNVGAAWPWHHRDLDSYICGVCLAWEEGEPGSPVRSLYAPVCGHQEVGGQETTYFPREAVRQWLIDHTRAGCRFVTQAGIYDWGWLSADLGVPVPPPAQLEEVGAAATMVDENRYEYNLDALCAWRGLAGKDERLLREAGEAFGFVGNKALKANLWRLPARFAGPYGEADAVQTLAVLRSLEPELERQELRDAYRLEVDLLPMVIEMRRRGIRVDVEAAERNRDELYRERDRALSELADNIEGELGIQGRVSMDELGQSKWMMRVFDAAKINYPVTPKTRVGSFTAGSTGWMHKHPHWLPRGIVRADLLHNAASKFIEGYILKYARLGGGRIHSEIHPHRSDEGGTRTLRFSYSDPPLQQFTGREKKLAPGLPARIRGVMLPEPNQVWAKPDQSQQEYRMIVHYAYLLGCQGAERAVAAYRNDPDTDFHNYVVGITGLERQAAKDTNFAKSYGTGVPHFAEMINKTVEEAAAIYEQYDRELPFVQEAFNRLQSKAAATGFVRLLDGARRHFDLWEPTWLSDSERGWGFSRHQKMNSCGRDEAVARTKDKDHAWRGKRLRRADTKDAFNSLIQGGSARQTKIWMRLLWNERIVPLLQLHDELDVSVESEEEGRRVQQLGVEAVRLEVPSKVDIHYGSSWGDAKHDWDEKLRAL